MMIRRDVVFSIGLALAGVGCGQRSGEVGAPPSEVITGTGSPSIVEAGSRPQAEPEQEPESEPAPDPTRVLVTVHYTDGSLSGRVEDREVRVGDRSIKLSRLRRWQRGYAEELVPDNREPIEGKVEGLDTVEMTIGSRPRRLDLARATAIDFECRNGLTPTPRLEALLRRQFIPPSPGRSPTTYYRAIRPTARSKVEDREIRQVSEKRLQNNNYTSFQNNGFDIDYKTPEKTENQFQLYFMGLVQPIEIGKPYEAAWSSGLGKFVVRELEQEEGKGPHSPIKRLAIDYYYKDEEVGVIRYHSSLK